jgi:inner membrane protein
MGLKLLIVCTLAFSMTIPGYYVGGLVDDRTNRAAEVMRQISSASGGGQTFLGPTLAIPYRGSPVGASPADAYLVFPNTASATLKMATEERRLSLFKIPVYRADVKFDADFDLARPLSAVPPGRELDWSRAEILAGVSDSRGALDDATLSTDGKTIPLLPEETFADLLFGAEHAERLKLAFFGTRLDAVAQPDSRFHITASMRFSGAQKVSVLAYGKTTRLSAQGDWPNPGFGVSFLPLRRTVTRTGFTSEWSIPFIARGVRAEGPASSMAALERAAPGITFVEPADPYQSVGRSLKYELLFVGLIFLRYFVLEGAAGKRVHPAQYVLVGIAQMVFYLLLLSLAERIGFDWAFLLAGGATVGLLATNAGWVFASRLQGIRALAAFTLLYVVIYLLLRAEDNALLVGAIAGFLAIGATMYLTRRIDWYAQQE